MHRRDVLIRGTALLAALATPAVPAHAHPGPVEPPGSPGTPSSPVPPEYRSGWQTLPPIGGGARQEHGVVALGSKVYVIAGIAPTPGGGFTTTNRVEAYDSRTGRWSDVAPLPVAMNHPNAAAVGGRIYVLGGLSGGESWQALRDAYVFDPRTNRWSPVPFMPPGTERGSAAVGVHGPKIYLAGGMRTLTPQPGGLQDTVDAVSCFDVTTGRWESLPSLPEARDHAGGALIAATLYVVGGRDRGQAHVRGEVYALDLRTRRWSRRASMPTARGGIAAAAIGTTIYTFGGEGNPAPGSQGVFPNTEAYDTTRDRWQILAPMPAPRHGTAAAAVGNTIHIPGGGTKGGGAPVDTHDAYPPHGR
ncbi:kelch repeat-containing protein [Streptomyces sp. NPDC002589]|uniref:Kelch repeat-containing protein n=1 Tax=Streptomyces sp. NPDC002589 TaxID=3154420 RepID=UPI003325ECE9